MSADDEDHTSKPFPMLLRQLIRSLEMRMSGNDS